MKVLFLCPSQYSIHKTIIHALKMSGHKPFHYDYRDDIKSWRQKINVQMFRLPYRIRRKWEIDYFRLINKNIISVYQKTDPEIVLIYNNEMLLPETVQYFKNKANVIFLLGDHPFYTPTNNYFLSILFYSDLIISPDSFWMEQLKKMGINKIIHDFPFYNKKDFHKLNKSKKYDFIYVGNTYVNSWGYKKALFLNHFTKYNLQIYGNKSWSRWYRFFPDIEKCLIFKEGFIPFEDVNILYNSAKLLPVDMNPGLLNGIHLRVFDAIASGTLPVVEYSKDIDIVFDKVKIPVIKNFPETSSVVEPLLKNNHLREDWAREAYEFLNEKYDPVTVLHRILSNI